jgi:hypothetical protein
LSVGLSQANLTASDQPAFRSLSICVSLRVKNRTARPQASFIKSDWVALPKRTPAASLANRFSGLATANHGDRSRYMPLYEIFFLCPDCEREHPTHLRIHLNAGPTNRESLAEFVTRHAIPPQLASIRGRRAFCLKTGRRFTLEQDERIFLAPSNRQ